MMSLTRAVLCAGLLLLCTAPQNAAQAQRRGQPAFLPNVPYDGRLTFVRVKYQIPEFCGGFLCGRDIPWSHDYPRGERNFT